MQGFRLETHPPGRMHRPTWQASEDGQGFSSDLHSPARQNRRVHKSSDPQSMGVLRHPELVKQVSKVQASLSSQEMVAPTHCPVWQVSGPVHAFPSSQATLFALVGLEQVPVRVSQMPTVWHWSNAEHTTLLEPTHTPPWHVSVLVHKLPSEHGAPSDTTGFVHPDAGTQTPTE